MFAGLLPEYADVDTVLARVRAMLRPEGTLVTVPQLPSAETAAVTPSPYASLTAPEDIMHLVPPATLRGPAGVRGCHKIEESTHVASGGKRFHMQAFRLGREDAPPRGGAAGRGRAASDSAWGEP